MLKEYNRLPDVMANNVPVDGTVQVGQGGSEWPGRADVAAPVASGSGQGWSYRGSGQNRGYGPRGNNSGYGGGNNRGWNFGPKRFRGN